MWQWAGWLQQRREKKKTAGDGRSHRGPINQRRQRNTDNQEYIRMAHLFVRWLGPYPMLIGSDWPTHRVGCAKGGQPRSTANRFPLADRSAAAISQPRPAHSTLAHPHHLQPAAMSKTPPVLEGMPLTEEEQTVSREKQSTQRTAKSRSADERRAD